MKIQINSHAGRAGTHVQGFVNPGVMRGSTVLQPDIATRKAAGGKRLEQAWIYGTAGGPTHWALENTIAEIEGGTRCQIVSTGLAAVTTPLMAYLSQGDHCLMPDSVYGPARNFASGLLAKDARIAAELAEELGCDGPFIPLSAKRWAQARDRLGPTEDMSKAIVAWQQSDEDPAA